MEITIFGRQYFINKLALGGMIFVLVIGAGLLGYFLKQVYQPLSGPVVEKNAAPSIELKAKDTRDGTPVQEEAEEVPKIKVYVVGCVNKPGVVTLEKGQVIDDAIKAAGGATGEADLENINLAYELKDNTMLRIKSKSEAQGDPASQSPASSASNASKSQAPAKPAQQKAEAAQSGRANSGADIINDSLGAVVADEKEKSGEGKENSLVNINTATQAELEGLPNVGPATAKAIMEYREKNGGFKVLTDLMKITGIKQKTYDKIKDFICVD